MFKTLFLIVLPTLVVAAVAFLAVTTLTRHPWAKLLASYVKLRSGDGADDTKDDVGSRRKVGRVLLIGVVISVAASCFLALMVWLLQMKWLIRFAEWLESVVPEVVLFVPFILYVALMVAGPVFMLAGCFTWLPKRSLIPVVIGQLAIVGLWVKFDWWLLHDLLATMAAAAMIMQLQFRASFLRLSLILLVAAFLYDAIQVFGTGNMSTYAEAIMSTQETAHQERVYGFPVLFVIPEGFAQHATWAGMLGLGDVFVGGVMAVTALRVGRRVGTYVPFYAVVGAFAASLLCADIVIRQFHAMQPATIYIVPLCMGAVMLWAWLSGHWAELKKPAFGKELYAPDQQ